MTNTISISTVDRIRAALLANPQHTNRFLSKMLIVRLALVAEVRKQMAHAFTCSRCGWLGEESLKRPGICRRCSVALDTPLATDDGLRVALPLPPPPPPRPILLALERRLEHLADLIAHVEGEPDPQKATALQRHWLRLRFQYVRIRSETPCAVPPA